VKGIITVLISVAGAVVVVPLEVLLVRRLDVQQALLTGVLVFSLGILGLFFISMIGQAAITVAIACVSFWLLLMAALIGVRFQAFLALGIGFLIAILSLAWFSSRYSDRVREDV